MPMRFLRTMGEPELAYGDALWIVRIVLLTCVALHITAAFQLTRMNWQARPVGYQTKKDVETTFAALTMRWSGVILALFIVYHIAHLTLGAVGFQPGQFQHLQVYENVVAGFSVWTVAVLHHGDGRPVPASGPRGLEHAPDARAGTTQRNTGLRILSRVVAMVVFAGFISVPVAVLAGWIH